MSAAGVPPPSSTVATAPVPELRPAATGPNDGLDLLPSDRRLVWLTTGGGLGISALILLALHFAQRVDVVKPMVESRELRAVVLPPPPPPPAVRTRQPPPPELMEMIPVPTASPVRFVVPLEPVPVLQVTSAPAISFSPGDFRPESRLLDAAPDRIFHAAEVDRIPVPVYRKIPRVAPAQLRQIKDPRVRLTFIVNVRGGVESITVLQAATPEYGQLVADAVAEWRFEPAMKGGQRVRCFVLQSVTVRASSGGSPFTTD